MKVIYIIFLCVCSCLCAYVDYCNIEDNQCSYTIKTVYDNSGTNDTMTYIINSTCDINGLVLNVGVPIEISECGSLGRHMCADMNNFIGVSINCMNLTIKLEKGSLGQNVIGLESHGICSTCLIKDTYKPNSTNISPCYNKWDCSGTDQCTDASCVNHICVYKKISGCYKCKNITDCQFLNDTKYNNWFCNDVTGTCLHAPLNNNNCVSNEDCKKFNKECFNSICNEGICEHIGNDSCCYETTKNIKNDKLCELCDLIGGCQYEGNYKCGSYSKIGTSKFECDNEDNKLILIIPIVVLLLIIVVFLSLILIVFISQRIISCKSK